MPRSAEAQSQEWAAQLVVSPFPSPYLSEWERNPQSLRLAVTFSGQGLRDYTIVGTVRSPSRGEVARAESPVLTVPGGPTVQMYDASDLLSWRLLPGSPDDVELALRTGVLPEDDYDLCARVLSSAGLQLAEDCAPISIVLPDRPELIYPGPGDGVPGLQPTFQWTPVSVPPTLGVTYRVRIVERVAGQTPAVALEANLPLLEQEVLGAPLLQYPLDGLPLEVGREYVWQVEALDGSLGALSPGGLVSEVHSFRVESSHVSGEDDEEGLWHAFDLIPGVARLTGLDGADRESTAFGMVFDGRAELELLLPAPATIPVSLRGLAVDRVGMRVTSGELSGAVAGALGDALLLPPGVELDRIAYSPGEGLTASASFQLPGEGNGLERRIELDGVMQITGAGLFGTFEAALAEGEQIRIGSDPIELRFTEVRAVMPGAVTSLAAELDAFGTPGVCRLNAGVDEGGSWSSGVNCAGEVLLPLAEGGSRAGLHVLSLVGSISADLSEGSLAPALGAGALLQLDPGYTGCVAHVDLQVDDLGVDIEGVRPRCGLPGAEPAPLDWLTLGLSNLRVDRLAYRPDSGVELDLRIDLRPRLPSVPGLILPTFADVVVSGAGFEVGALDEPLIPERLEVQGVSLRARHATSEGFTITWDDWEAGSAAPVSLSLEATGGLPGMPSEAPECLSSITFTLSAATLASGRLEGAAVEGDLPGGVCVVALGGGAELQVEVIEGELALTLAPEPGLVSAPSLTGRLRLPDAFACELEADRVVPLVEMGIALEPGGVLRGEFAGITPPCPFATPGLQLDFDEGTLRLALGGGESTLALEAGASVLLAATGEPTPASGSIVVDLLEGRILSGALELEGPIALDLPRTEPVLSFAIEQARLDPEGLHVDGRAELALPPGDPVGATFVGVTLDPDTPGISDGRIHFDEPFALVADAGARPLRWGTAAADAPFDVASGVRLVVPDEATLDGTGLRVSGAAEAGLVLEGRELAEIDAVFDDAFLLALAPPAVEAGRVDLRRGGVGVAHIDRQGFHVNFAELGAGILPERLPLPSEAVAFLELRDPDGTPRVEVNTTDRGVELRSRPGEGVPLVLPAFPGPDGQSGVPPMLSVELELLLDADRMVPIEGEVRVGLVDPAGGVQDPLGMEALGLPIAADSLVFAAGDGGGALELVGGLQLVGEPLGAPGSTRLRITEGGILTGVTEGGADLVLPLVEGSERVAFEGGSFTGDFQVDLLSGGGSWSIDVAGALALGAGEGDPHRTGLTLRASAAGLEAVEIEAAPAGMDDPETRFDLGPVRISLAGLRVPRIAWSREAGWDFELLVDLGVQPAVEELELPPARDVRVTPDGLVIPALSLGELDTPAFALGDFRVRPLAARSEQVAWDLFREGWPAAWRMTMDLELTPGPAAPEALADLRLSVLEATWEGGRVTGTIEPRSYLTPLVLPLGSGGLALELEHFRGELADEGGEQVVRLETSGSWLRPTSLQCPADDGAPEALPGAWFELEGDGTLTGRAEGVVPACPLRFGPLAVTVETSVLEFGRGPGGTTAALALDGALVLPAPAPGESVTSPGSLVVDLLNGTIVEGSIGVSEAFAWDLPVGSTSPLVRLVVDDARLDGEGFHFAGSGRIPLGDDSEVSVAFDALTFALPSFAITSGSATLGAAVALDAGIGAGALSWSLRHPDAPREASTDGLRMVAPAGVVLDPDGLRLLGEGSAAITFGGESLAELGLALSPELQLALDPMSVTDGRAGFLLEGSEVAYLDASGFWPGDLFGTVALPARIGLPTESVAYLQLRSPATDEPLVEALPDDGGLRIVGSDIALVIPSLAGTGSPPSVTIDLDVLVNPATFALVQGELRATGGNPGSEPLFDLTPLGLPLDVRSVAWVDAGSGYRLTLGGRVMLPGILDDMELDWDEVSLTPDGLSGRVEWGSLEGTGGPGDGLGALDFGHAAFVMEGVRADFDASAVELAGRVDLPLFSDGQSPPEPLRFSGALSTDGTLEAAFSSGAASARLPLGVARFDPLPIGGEPALQLGFTESDFDLRVSGVLGFPAFSESFELTVPGIRFDRSGVHLAAVTVETAQQFGLFGSTLTLGGDDGSPPLTLEVLEEGGLALTMSGSIRLAFVPQEASFRGLRVDTRGQISLTEASLLSEPLPIVPEVLVLAELGIADAILETAFDLTLPAPIPGPEGAGEGVQRVNIAIQPDGTVEGGGQVVVLDEPVSLEAALPGSSPVRTQLRYVGLDLDFGDGATSSVQAVADLYLGNREENRIAIGRRSGGTVLPGLRIGFDGTVTWGNVSLPSAFEFDYDLVALSVTDVSMASTSQSFELGFGGELRVALPAVEGGLQFQDFRINSAAQVGFNASGVAGGELTVGGVVGLNLEEFGFSSEPTTIQVSSGAIPSGDAAVAAAGRVDIDVTSYLRFGGGIHLMELDFAGGVDEVLFYRDQDGEVAFVVLEAELSLPNLLEASADLRYFQRGRGFELMLAADASLFGAAGAALVGIIEVEPQVTPRAGLFVALDAVIPLAPPFSLNRIGGGILFNPREEHLAWVQSQAMGSSVETPVESSSGLPTGRFTAMVYAGAQIVDESVASGRVLLTASEAQARIQGEVELLSVATGALSSAGVGSSPDSPPIGGTLDIEMGFRQAYLEGNLDLRVDLAPLVDGSGWTEIFIYGPNAWGLSGGGALNYMRVLEGDVEFYVGPPGLLVGGSIFAELDLWIARASGEVEVAAWFQREYGGQAQDLGAYFEAMVQAGILGNAISASGTLRGALLSGPLIYGGALVEGCVVFLGCRDANVWAKIASSGITGGFGSDPVLDEIIGRANSVRTAMASSRSSIEDEMAQARPAATVLRPSEEELAEAFARVGALDSETFDATIDEAIAVEGNPSGGGLDRHFRWFQTLFPVHSKTAAYKLDNQGYEQAIEATLGEIATLREPVLERIAEIRTELLQIEQASRLDWPGSPLGGVSFEPPRTQAGTDAEGRETRTLVSGPGFQVDAAAAEESRQAMTAYEAETRALVQELGNITRELDESLLAVERALGDESSEGILHFAQLHADLLETSSILYALWGALLLDEQDRNRGVVASLIEAREPVRDLLLQRTTEVQQTQGPDGLRALALGRAGILAAWTENPAILSELESSSVPTEDAVWWHDAAMDLGVQLWIEVPRAGLEAADARYAPEFAEVRRALDAAPGPVRSHLEPLTIEIARLQIERARLTGTLYDLYDRYAALLPAYGDEATLAGEQERAATRMHLLERALAVPVITDASVRVHALGSGGYGYREALEITASHPGAIHEYLVDNRIGGAGPGMGFIGQHPTGLLSSGRRPLRTRYTLIPERDYSGSMTRTFRSGARGGAGFMGVGLTTYEVAWESGIAVSDAGSSISLNVPSHAPSPPSPRFRVGDDEWSSSPDGHWVTNAERLELRLQGAFHAESGIVDIEYAVGTASDTTAVRGWTSVGGRTELAVHGLPLRTDESNIIYARAQAGNGVWSAVRQSVPLRHDPTPPVFSGSGASDDESDLSGELPPLLEALDREARELASDFGALNAGAFEACPLGDPAPFHPVQPDEEMDADLTTVTFSPLLPSGGRTPERVPPAITIGLPTAADPESGVRGYVWAVTADTPPGPYRGEGWNPIGSGSSELALGEANAPLDYDRTLHLAVAAQNGAGAWSLPVTRSFRVLDPTAPLAPIFCIEQAPVSETRTRLDGATETRSAAPAIRVEILDRAVDPESGIASLEYRIRTAAGEVVRDFPGVADWLSAPTGRAIDIPLPAGPDGTRYYVDVRVRNGQGVSAVSSSGPLLIDGSPPPTPSIRSLRIMMGSGDASDLPVGLELDVLAPDDPHSGLRRGHHQYALFALPDRAGDLGIEDGPVTDPELITALLGTPLAGGSVTNTGTGTYTGRIGRLQDLLEPRQRYVLRLRTVNGANLPGQATTWIFTAR